MERYPLDIGFKGERNYIQGPDMLNQAMQIIQINRLGEIRDIEFFIQRMTSQHLQLEIEQAEASRSSSPDDVAVIKFTIGEERLFARLTTAPGAPQARVPYDESLVTRHCQINTVDRSIRLAEDSSGHSSIEKLVSMNKALHLALLEKPDDTQWVFCRWDSAGWPLPEDLNHAEVVLKQTLGSRLTRADVMLNECQLGQIYFSAKPTS
ncbi:hypothetical protein ACLPJF_07910 [Pseudomonas vlassakiae]|uniref:hypothetical protein n=1 Tax=Pseudomonas TaxID=286 RepID=UPI000C17DBAE|nr:hypothetical protein [Pseudomonas sp. 382]AXQ49176.1 hypothetical protein DZC31_20245 [Stenotrophomonas rhizophila]PIK78030.1 hypothetical protein CQW31_13585 [Pseudomonas sp. 382]